MTPGVDICYLTWPLWHLLRSTDILIFSTWRTEGLTDAAPSSGRWPGPWRWHHWLEGTWWRAPYLTVPVTTVAHHFITATSGGRVKDPKDCLPYSDLVPICNNCSPSAWKRLGEVWSMKGSLSICLDPLLQSFVQIMKQNRKFFQDLITFSDIKVIRYQH